MNYDKKYFRNYVTIVLEEMDKRKIKFQEKYYDEILDFTNTGGEIDDFIITSYSYYPEHNDRYLKQCYYNLQEKYDRRNNK